MRGHEADGSGARRFGFRRARASSLMPKPPEDQLALMTALDSVAASISSARGVSELLGIIVESAKRFTGTEKVVVCLTSAGDDGLELDESSIVVRGSRADYAEEWWGQRLHEMAADVCEQGEPFFEADHAQGAWMLAVPMRTGDAVVGMLVAINALNHRLLPEHTAFLSILGAFAAVAIANARLAEQSRYAMLAGERERIAREMHDGISQSLFSVSLGMELCRKLIPRDPVSASTTLDDLQGQLSHSAAELRRLIYDLRPLKLREMGLEGSVESWLREATRGTAVTGSIESAGECPRLGSAQEVCLYRVAKEAISNAVRHSGCTRVDVLIEYGSRSVIVTVRDDGDGFGPTNTGGGFGLRNMRERAVAEGGTFEILSTPGDGTLVRTEIPIGGSDGSYPRGSG